MELQIFKFLRVDVNEIVIFKFTDQTSHKFPKIYYFRSHEDVNLQITCFRANAFADYQHFHAIVESQDSRDSMFPRR